MAKEGMSNLELFEFCLFVESFATELIRARDNGSIRTTFLYYEIVVPHSPFDGILVFDAYDNANRLKEKEDKLQSIENSRSYKFAKALSGVYQKLRQRRNEN